MNEIVNDKTVLIYDDGLFMWLADRLSRDFMTVYLYIDWKSDYPKSSDAAIGTNIPNVIRVYDFWLYAKKADLIVFPGLYHGDMQQVLVNDFKKPVWGSKFGDEFERERLKTNQWMQKVGLPHPEIVSVKGIDKLRNYLKEVDERYIKVSNYRKDFETWKHVNYELSEMELDKLEHKLGKLKDDYEFIVEKPIKGDDIVEAGYDGYCINGKFPDKTIFGMEIKDVAYCGHVKDYSDISPLITDFNDKISEELEKHEYCNFFSTEQRIGSDKVSTCIDITTRMASPPGELFCEMCLNLPEIFWYGALGIMVNPIFEDEYGVQIFIDSPWSENEWYPIQFPKEISRWVKLRNYCIMDDTYYVIPKYTNFDNIGSVLATGKSIKECFKKIEEYTDQIKGSKNEINLGSINEINEVIKRASDIGIMF